MTPALQSSIWDAAATLVGSAFAKAPALMLGLGILAAVPVLVALGGLIVFATRGRRSNAAGSEAPPMDGPTQSWRRGPAGAALRRGDETTARIDVKSPLVRIGRHDDNDVRIETDTTHRYHAIVHRGEDGRFWVVDLSGDGGNGVLVDGERVQRRRLAGGERIEIGGETLTFAVEGMNRRPPS